MRTIDATIIGLCTLAVISPCRAYMEYSGTGTVTATYRVGAVTTTTSCAAEIKLFLLYEATDYSTSADEFAFEFTRWKFSFDEIWDPQFGTLLPPKSLLLNCLSNDWKAMWGTHANGNLTALTSGGEHLNGFPATYTLLQGKYGPTGVTNLSFKAEWWVDINAERITAIYEFPLLPRKLASEEIDHLVVEPPISSPQLVNQPFWFAVYALTKEDKRCAAPQTTVALSDSTGTISPSTMTLSKGWGVTRVTLTKTAKNVTITDLTMDDGVDIYKIVVTSLDSSITLTFTHAEGDLDLYVLDDEFEVIDASKSSDNDESLFASAPANGTYYILVSAAGCPPGATAQTYSLFWNDGI